MPLLDEGRAEEGHDEVAHEERAVGRHVDKQGVVAPSGRITRMPSSPGMVCAAGMMTPGRHSTPEAGPCRLAKTATTQCATSSTARARASDASVSGPVLRV